MNKIIELNNSIFALVQSLLSPIFLLFIRVWVAWVFFKSGQLKYSSWDSTIYLFTSEYKVPFLSPEIAAYLATATELAIPVLLVFGIFTRASAAMLFVFNIIAVVSYPALTEDGFSLFSLGVMDHQIWGLMLLTTVIFGAGKLSADYLLKIK